MGERSLTDLGRHVASLQDQAPEAARDHERGRARFLASRLGGQRPPQTPRSRLGVRVVAPLAAALVLAALALVFVKRPRDAMRFDVGAAEPGVVGAWIAAPTGAELPIRFSDGSVLRLAPGGRARVAAVGEDGAEVALERGSLDLSVVHREATRWTVRVGPFQVNVIGTKFETRWDPVTERFEVALREGAITVSGPVVGEKRAVRAGERLVVSPAAGTLEVGSIHAETHDAPAPVPFGGAEPPAPPATVTRGAEPAPHPPVSMGGDPPYPPAQPVPALHPGGHGGSPSVMPPASSPSVAPVAPPEHAAASVSTWRALALDARYKEALAEAEREGFDGICASAGAGDLWALGDAARLGGGPGRSVQAFSTLRTRFPGTAEAASAAFILGRIAQDQNRDPGGAAGWFSRYLAEQPGGAFAEDALGRLVEADDKLGDEAGARRAAERYLAAYPNGSHAGYARRVLAH